MSPQDPQQELLPCPHRGRLVLPNFPTQAGVRKPLYWCDHPKNERKTAVPGRCNGCQPRVNDPVPCSHCPWFDLEKGEERPVPLPYVFPSREKKQPADDQPKPKPPIIVRHPPAGSWSTQVVRY